MKKLFVLLLLLACGVQADTKVRFTQVAGAPINVIDKGAKCDGVTDDSVAFQAAINEAQAKGKSVYVPSSSLGCVIPTSKWVNITESNITIYGDGPSSIIYIKGSTWRNVVSVPTQQAYFQVANATKDLYNVAFYRLHFVGDYPNGTTGPLAAVSTIVFGFDNGHTVNNVSVSECIFEKLGGMGVGFDGNSGTISSNESVTNNQFINSGSFNDQVNAFSYGHRNTVISGNVFKSLYGSAIEWAGTSAVISNNQMEDVAGWGIAFDNAAGATQEGYSIISNNNMLDVGKPNALSTPNQAYHCIQMGEVNGVARTRVFGNTIRNCAGGGIVLTGGQSDVDVSENYVDCPGYQSATRTVAFNDFAGIWARLDQRSRVVNNFVRACPTGAGHQSNIGIYTGGNGLTDGWASGNVTVGTFLSRSIITSVSLGGAGGGTRQFAGFNFDLTAGRYITSMDQSNGEFIPWFAQGASTPSVAGNPFNVWRTNNIGATELDKFLNPYPGQVITIHFGDSLTTLSSNCGAGAYFICLQDNVYKKFSSGDAIQLMFNEAEWVELATYRKNTAGTCVIGTSCSSNVPADCKPFCQDTTSGASCVPSLSGTSLTITGTSGHSINWMCAR